MPLEDRLRKLTARVPAVWVPVATMEVPVVPGDDSKSWETLSTPDQIWSTQATEIAVAPAEDIVMSTGWTPEGKNQTNIIVPEEAPPEPVELKSACGEIT